MAEVSPLKKTILAVTFGVAIALACKLLDSLS